jgi:hypothetical protein
MKHQSLSSTSASDASVWIILAGLLLFSALIGAGSMAVIKVNNSNNMAEQGQTAAPAQPAPAPH